MNFVKLETIKNKNNQNLVNLLTNKIDENQNIEIKEEPISITYIIMKLNNINYCILNLFNPDKRGFKIKNSVLKVFDLILTYIGFEVPRIILNKYYTEIGLVGIIKKIENQFHDFENLQSKTLNMNCNEIFLILNEKYNASKDEYGENCRFKFFSLIHYNFKNYLEFILNISDKIYANKFIHLKKYFNFIKFLKLKNFNLKKEEEDIFIVEEKLILINLLFKNIIKINNDLKKKNYKNYLDLVEEEIKKNEFEKENESLEDNESINSENNFEEIKSDKIFKENNDELYNEFIKNKNENKIENLNNYIKKVKETKKSKFDNPYKNKRVNLIKELEEYKKQNLNEETNLIKELYDDLKEINYTKIGLVLDDYSKTRINLLLTIIRKNLLILLQNNNNNKFLFSGLLEEYLYLNSNLYENISI